MGQLTMNYSDQHRPHLEFTPTYNDFIKLTDDILGKANNIMSSTFLNEAEFLFRHKLEFEHNNFKFSNDSKYVLCDMETYEFMKCCVFNEYYCVGGIRIVSDFALHEKFIKRDENGELKLDMKDARKLIRNICHFGDACRKFVRLLIYTDCDYTDKDLSIDLLRKYTLQNDMFNSSILYKLIADHPISAATIIKQHDFLWKGEATHTSALKIHKMSLKSIAWKLFSKYEDCKTAITTAKTGLKGALHSVFNISEEDMSIILNGTDSNSDFTNPIFILLEKDVVLLH